MSTKKQNSENITDSMFLFEIENSENSKKSKDSENSKKPENLINLEKSEDLGDVVNKTTNLKKFFKKVKYLRLSTTEFYAQNPSTNLKKMYDDAAKSHINDLVNEFADIESPERDYLIAIVRHAGIVKTDSSVSSSRTVKNVNSTKYSEIKFPKKVSEKDENILYTPIKELELPLAVINKLNYHFLSTQPNHDATVYFGELVEMSKQDIANVRGFGYGSLVILNKFIKSYGYKQGEKTNFDIVEAQRKDTALRTPSEEKLKKLDIPITEFYLDKRIEDMLIRNNKVYMGDLVKYSEKNLRIELVKYSDQDPSLLKLCKRSLNIIKKTVSSAGLEFEMKINYTRPEAREQKA